jgi:uncharacterized protein YacL (UPF0231 family)
LVGTELEWFKNEIKDNAESLEELVKQTENTKKAQQAYDDLYGK